MEFLKKVDIKIRIKKSLIFKPTKLIFSIEGEGAGHVQGMYKVKKWRVADFIVLQQRPGNLRVFVEQGSACI